MKPIPPPALDPDLRRPPASASRIALFERHVQERLTPTALELLLDAARVLAEGERRAGADGQEVFFGSVMITVELGASAAALADPCDALSARRVAELLATDAAAQKRVRALAEAEAARVAGARLVRVVGELRARARDTRIDVDLDVEGTVLEPAVPR